MSQPQWVPIQTIFCPRINAEAKLLEKRSFLGTTDEFGAPDYIVQGRACSHDIDCNMNDYIHCRWSFKGGDDPFSESTAVEPGVAVQSGATAIDEEGDE